MEATEPLEVQERLELGKEQQLGNLDHLPEDYMEVVAVEQI